MHVMRNGNIYNGGKDGKASSHLVSRHLILQTHPRPLVVYGVSDWTLTSQASRLKTERRAYLLALGCRALAFAGVFLTGLITAHISV